MINQYNTAWLRNDSAAIMDLFADPAILIPSGMDPIQGKSNISAFWWPNDTSKTTIDDYKISDFQGNKNLMRLPFLTRQWINGK